jgi:hypothetical protein
VQKFEREPPLDLGVAMSNSMRESKIHLIFCINSIQGDCSLFYHPFAALPTFHNRSLAQFSSGDKHTILDVRQCHI